MFSASRPVLLALILFVVLWTVIPSLLHTAPPLDVVESGTWGREGVLLSYKHPNLPGLLIEATYRLTGQYGWPQYLLSAFAGAGTIWLVYLLGSSMLGVSRGAAGALLLLGCYYFTWPIPEFNHNVAQQPVWAAMALLLWLAVRDDRWWQWLLLAVIAGVGLYAKLSTLAIIGAGGIWLMADPKARSRLLGSWPWVALLLFAVIAGGYAWQVEAGGRGLVRFIGQSGANGGGPVDFIAAQLLDILPLLIVAGIAVARRQPRHAETLEAAELSRVRRYLAIMLAVPLLSGVVAAALTGAQDMWGAPMLNLVGLTIVAFWPRRFDAIAVRRVATAGLVLVLVAPTLFAVRHIVSYHTAANPIRTQWPQQAIAARLSEIWQEETAEPLGIVGGNAWIAGLASLNASPRASVFYRLDPHLSPWVTAERVASEGMLVVWQGQEWPDYALPLLEGHVHGVEHFDWSTSSAAKPIEIGYVIVPP